MTTPKRLPTEFTPVRDAAIRALGAVHPGHIADFRALYGGRRSNAGRALPAYYLVYFLLVELLGFENLGQGDKVAWSVPVEYKGQTYLIEHRKMGLGIFADDVENKEDDIREIVIRIQKAIKVATPYFEWLADQGLATSAVNVRNNSSELFDRYKFFTEIFQAKSADAQQARIDERSKVRTENARYVGPVYVSSQLRQESRWLALAAIDAFYSWTEHVFIHLAILLGHTQTADEITALAQSEWSAKYKAVFDLTEKEAKSYFDKLSDIRYELRNFVAHGAFGKRGEAYHFHSGAGAVPVFLPHKAGSRKYRVDGGIAFREEDALVLIDSFINFLWSDGREPARAYLHDTELPIILTYAKDGTYAAAMASVEDMNAFIDHEQAAWDRAADMDY
ncbi:TPA: hypothetical protein ACUNF5_006521 [Burkholderia orbicola]|uniref:hypothetical protein n=1 Tax=Burkholderia orbicola TaxID=2978683 RepID=UPI00264CA807|nr:hypothetical protein [Burkholderia orbicola]MDN7533943.1 hypothetical protein [Burkholderia orbicola]